MALLVTALLAGCADDGEEPLQTAPAPSVDTTTREVDTSPTETPAPGPTPWPEPTRPEAMERDDIEGAKGAAEYFMALYPYVFATGDLQAWHELSHPECQFCNGAARRVTDLFDAGGYATGGDFTITDVVAIGPDDSQSAYRVGLTGVEEPSMEYSNSGVVSRSLAGGDARYSFAVMREAGRWVITGGSVEAVND